MTELTTEQLDETRRILAAADDYDNPDIHEARAVLTHRVPALLDGIERLRAENQRLRLKALTADREAMELDAENQRLQTEVARLKAANGHLQQELARKLAHDQTATPPDHTPIVLLARNRPARHQCGDPAPARSDADGSRGGDS